MSARLTAAQKGQLLDLVTDVVRAAVNGNVPFESVVDGLRGITRSRQAVYAKPSLGQASTKAQIELVTAFLERYGDGQVGYRPSDIPDVPVFTDSANMLVLAVYLPAKGRISGLGRTLDAWWDFIVPPDGITKQRAEELKSDSKHLRLIPGVKCTPGIRWVELTPHSYRGKSSKYAIAQSSVDGTTLAHVEVLMAAAQFPEWVSGWDGVNSLYPNMAAIQLCLDDRWLYTAYLNRSSTGDKLHMGAFDTTSNVWGSKWASPTVKVL